MSYRADGIYKNYNQTNLLLSEDNLYKQETDPRPKSDQ